MPGSALDADALGELTLGGLDALHPRQVQQYLPTRLRQPQMTQAPVELGAPGTDTWNDLAAKQVWIGRGHSAKPCTWIFSLFCLPAWRGNRRASLVRQFRLQGCPHAVQRTRRHPPFEARGDLGYRRQFALIFEEGILDFRQQILWQVQGCSRAICCPAMASANSA